MEINFKNELILKITTHESIEHIHKTENSQSVVLGSIMDVRGR